MFPVPLTADLDMNHVIYVSGSPVTHCPGVGRAERGYLCIYQQRFQGPVNQPDSTSIENNNNPVGAIGAGAHGFAVYLTTSGPGHVDISGLYAVTAP